ncbi:hypothetical protein ABVK25_003041 [Lepraria finkii]|uniref:Uncharacterized protein n=1 Tax=Lepraria finkii TaxID=1340010 RepID=A0ABR4BFN4_9LECA
MTGTLSFELAAFSTTPEQTPKLNLLLNSQFHMAPLEGQPIFISFWQDPLANWQIGQSQVRRTVNRYGMPLSEATMAWDFLKSASRLFGGALKIHDSCTRRRKKSSSPSARF